jgi:hypothetical protein
MLIHPAYDPVAIAIGPLAIRWYGLMYLIAFLSTYLLGRWRIARGQGGGATLALLDDLQFFGVLGVILGGRLGYVLFYKPAYYLLHPLEIFAVWQGGMAFHGGFLGVLLEPGSVPEPSRPTGIQDTGVAWAVGCSNECNSHRLPCRSVPAGCPPSGSRPAAVAHTCWHILPCSFYAMRCRQGS